MITQGWSIGGATAQYLSLVNLTWSNNTSLGTWFLNASLYGGPNAGSATFTVFYYYQ